MHAPTVGALEGNFQRAIAVDLRGHGSVHCRVDRGLLGQLSLAIELVVNEGRRAVYTGNELGANALLSPSTALLDGLTHQLLVGVDALRADQIEYDVADPV